MNGGRFDSRLVWDLNRSGWLPAASLLFGECSREQSVEFDRQAA
jgi:hypothetical protein